MSMFINFMKLKRGPKMKKIISFTFITLLFFFLTVSNLQADKAPILSNQQQSDTASNINKTLLKLGKTINQTNLNAAETMRFIAESQDIYKKSSLKQQENLKEYNELIERYNLLQQEYDKIEKKNREKEALSKTIAENIPMNDLDILIANINALYKQETDPSTKRFLGKRGNIVDLFASFKNSTDAQKKKMMEIEQTLIATSNIVKKLKVLKKKLNSSQEITERNSDIKTTEMTRKNR